MFIALAAGVCGAQTGVERAASGVTQAPLPGLGPRLAHGVPSHDALWRLSQAVDPAAFRRGMAGFAAAAEQVVEPHDTTARRPVRRCRGRAPPQPALRASATGSSPPGSPGWSS
ncbi:hypothetical protein [Elioraea sp.]|uniref:hypothetical protein n=1 Tax=Elioraea sp. TaxID=2185103 RepID=UPI003F711FF8